MRSGADAVGVRAPDGGISGGGRRGGTRGPDRAYGAAAALVPYPVIKVTWVVGSLLGPLLVGRGFSRGGWLVLNTVTIGMADPSAWWSTWP